MKAIEAAGARIVGTRRGVVIVYGLPAELARLLAVSLLDGPYNDRAEVLALADALDAAAAYCEDPPPPWTAVYRYETEYGPGDEDDEQLDSEQEALERLRVSGPDGYDSDLVPLALVRPDGTRVEGDELQWLLWPPLQGPEQPPEPGVCVQVQHPCEVPPPDDFVMDARWQGVRLKPKRRRPGERVLTDGLIAPYLEITGRVIRWVPPAGPGEATCGVTAQWSLDARGATNVVGMACGRPVGHDGRHAAYDGDTILAVWSS